MTWRTFPILVQGYLDPEYYMSQQLTEKSDVYSFGVLMLEIISARKKPIMRGKHIVKEVKAAMDKTKDLYNLEELLDPTLGTTLEGFNKFVDLALRCVEESGAERPSMGEVVKEMENIMELTCLHLIPESSSASASYEESIMNTGSHPYGSHWPSDNRVGYSAHTVEPKWAQLPFCVPYIQLCQSTGPVLSLCITFTLSMLQPWTFIVIGCVWCWRSGCNCI